jgi:hypothetical protein
MKDTIAYLGKASLSPAGDETFGSDVMASVYLSSFNLCAEFLAARAADSDAQNYPKRSFSVNRLRLQKGGLI